MQYMRSVSFGLRANFARTSINSSSSRMKKNAAGRPRYYETAARASQASVAQRPLQAGGRDAAPQQRGMSSTTQESLTQATFASFPLSAATQRAISEVMGYTHCTAVQAESLGPLLSGADMVVKAKTGTGKTLAFLIPGIEQMMRHPPDRSIGMLVVSPTRELAAQIAEEAKQLTAFQQNFRVQVMFGGTNINKDVSALNRGPPHILVATPGRLLDHLQNAQQLKPMLHDLRMVVLDEADRLLDMGFRQEIEKILRFLPPKSGRQNVMFSATYPPNIQELAGIALNPQRQVVDTVGEEQTHATEQVEQQYLITNMTAQHAVLLAVIQEHMRADQEFKVMCFFTTARITQFYCALFNALGVPVLEMHSRKSQAQRTRAADQFRAAKRVIMFSSDVSARGVDYPDVSMVIQVGLATDKAQYIHRLGRTARAGKSGKGMLLLGDFEERFLGSLSELPLAEAAPLPASALAQAQAQVQQGLAAVDEEDKSQAYRTWLGFYKGSMKLCRWNAEQLVQAANRYAASLGCDGVPTIEKKTVGKMGLKGVPGLNLVTSDGGSRHNQGAQQQRTQGAKMPRNDSEGLWSNGSAPGRGPARNGTSGRPMRGAKRQHASPY